MKLDDKILELLETYNMTTDDLRNKVDDRTWYAMCNDYDTHADYWDKLKSQSAKPLATRSLHRYVCDIARGWIVEIAAQKLLDDVGVDYKLTGCDIDDSGKRVIKQRMHVTHDVDMIITGKNGEDIYVDVTGDHTGWIAKNGVVDFKIGKLRSLKKIADSGHSVYIWVQDSYNGKMALVCINALVLGDTLPHKYYGEVYQLDASDWQWVDKSATLSELNTRYMATSTIAA